MRPPDRQAVDERRLLGTVFLLAAPNLVGALLVFLFQNYLVTPGQAAAALHRAQMNFMAYLALSFPLAGICGYVLVRPVLNWLRSDRPPTEQERDTTLALPQRMGAMGFAFWLGAALVFGVDAVRIGESPREIARDAGATVTGGLTVALLSFLLVESWLRPVFARALDGGTPPRRRTAGIAPRILLSWALGSGVPLLAIAMSQLRIDDSIPDPSPAALAFLAALGVGSGALLLALAAKSVSQPIGAVRDALRRVQRGEVDIEVPVDDSGQIGQLQAGFNDMVQGIRERRQLEDLFGRYVGPEVAADALARGAGLGGEQRDVSALFVDVIGSTELAHGNDPATVVAALNEFFATVVEVVTREGGWVNKFEGDGALCVFGAPNDQPDHATRALHAARALQQSLATIAMRRPQLAAAIGVSTGAVVAGHVGAEERFEYTVIGDPVNEAARLVDAAKEVPGCLLASGSAIGAASPDERGRWTLISRVPLRGRTTPTDVWAPSA